MMRNYLTNLRLDIGWMVTHKFALNEYKQAFSVSDHKKQEEAIKIAFEFPN